MEEKNIIITTTDLKENYEILDSLYVVEQSMLTYQTEEKINQMFTKAKEKLRKQCNELGGNAVICCHPFINDLNLSISGTAVKIKSKS